MAVKRSKRIQLIVNIALNAEKQAARNLGLAQDAAQSERKRLEDVKKYYQNYSEHYGQRTQPVSASDISRSREFLANLDRACESQKAQVARCDKNVQDALQQWRSCHYKVQTLEKFQVQCANSEALEAAKLEQKLIDEMASLRLRHSV